ncbi:MAG: FG-GAP-like repeat-containing protein [Deltaproteobacteria bacterium]|nr:FG-GAP-like repeat-containing protein [Deltaproteobacteria bacterium]
MARRLVLALALLTACSVQDITFTEPVDAGPDAADPVDANTGPVTIVVTPATGLTVTEGSTKDFTVALSAPPPDGLVVYLASDDTKIALSRPLLQFGAGNWDIPQTVIVSGKQDADTVDEDVPVSLTATGSPDVVLPVTVDDDDGLALHVSQPALDVSEGGSATLAVRLTAQPTADVTVDVVSDALAVATVTPATLTFTAANWNVDQAVTVSGVIDANVVTDAATVTLSSTALTPVTVPVQVADRDQVGILPSVSSVALAEGTTTTFTVALTQQPTATTTVMIATADAGAATAAPTPLTFTTSTWSVPQTVTVTAPQDVDTAEENLALTLTATGLTTRTVAVKVSDDDTQVLVVSPGTVAMTENGTATVGVHLAFKPAADVTVTASTLAPAVATAAVPGGLLTFTSTNYGSDQTVTLNAPDDADAVPGSTTLRLEAAAAGLSTDVPIAVADDDQLTIIASAPMVTLTENASATFTVRLGAKPASDVTVAVASSDASAATASPASLVFTSANWSAPQTVTVAGVQDLDLVDESPTVTLSATGLGSQIVTTSVTDDDAQGIVLGAAALTVGEGGEGTVGVTLQYMPSADVTVAVASGSPLSATVAPATLTFKPTDYNVTQLVHVTGVTDADAVNDTTTVTFSSAGLADRTTAVTVTDVDHLGLEASVPSLSLGEGATEPIGLRLTAQPLADTSITIASSDATAATVGTATLTFTTANWHSYQNVVVSGVQDADAADESVAITATGTGLSLSVPVTIIDDEVLGIVTDATAVALAEGGTGTFAVKLAAQPAADVTVNLASDDVAAATVSPASLVFTTANWNTLRAVTITGVQDNDLANETVKITAASSGFPDRLVTASIADDDSQVLLVSPGAISVTEGQTSSAVGVSLKYMPAGTVTVAVASDDGTIATATPGTLTFDATNYATPKPVTLTGTQDADAAPDTTTVRMTAAGAAAGSATVNVVDDDVLGISVAASSITVAEAGTKKVAVMLSAKPQATTTVSVVSSDPGAATVTSSLVFTTANWNVPQDLTVAAVNDADVADETLTVSLSAPGMSASIAVAVTDDDVLGIATDVTDITLGEAGNAQFQVKLTAQPAGTVTVGIASADPNAATVSVASLDFTAADWNTYKPVKVFGVADQDLANETVAISLGAPGVSSPGVTAHVTDDDTQVVLVSAGTLGVTEGATGTFTVSLKYIPLAPTTITLVSDDTAAATVSPASVTLDATSYATGKPVTVTGVQDPDAAPSTATISATSGGATAQVAVTVTDDDTLGVTLAAPSLAIGEAGSGTVGVRLTAQPLVDTTVTLSSSDPGAATVTGSLVFTSLNWNQYQDAVVTGVSDTDTANESVTITVSGPGGNKTFAVTVTDDDTLGVATDLATVSLAEGGSGPFKVKLTAQPAVGTTVTVAVASTDAGAVTVSPASLSFTSANWSAYQTVTVTGVQDNDLASESVAITLMSSGLVIPSVTANVADDDSQVVQVSAGTLGVTEGATGTFTVSLKYIPLAATTVSLASDNAGATVSPASIMLDATNYATGKLVTVTGVQDADAAPATATVTASAPASTPATVNVTVTDDDVLGIAASPVTVTEGQSLNMKVHLTAQPPADVTVAVASTNAAVATVGVSSLVFTAGNWSTDQTVPVTGAQDSNTSNDSANVKLTATGLADVNAAVTVVDDDTLGVVTDLSTVSLVEGASGQFQVKLTAQPAATVTVAIASTDMGAVTVSPTTASLSFTTANWNAYQAVTLTGVQDNDLASESVAITLTSTGLVIPSVTANVNDDDTQVVQVAPASLAMTEGTTKTFDVTLKYIPSASVTVNLASGSATVATLSAATLNFTAANYGTAQTVTVTAVNDADAVAGSTGITASSAGATPGMVSVAVTDDDTLAIAASPVTVTEGQSKNMAVHLTAQPLSDVVVSVASSSTAVATVGSSSLTFTTANWSVDQNVAVTGAQDNNVANETGNVKLTAPGLADLNVAVTVTDDDVQAVQVAPATLALTEGTTKTFAVSLAYAPSGSVTVSLTSGSTAVATVSPASLMFTAANYATAQTVTVTAVDDADTIAGSTVITAASAGAMQGLVSVAVTDDDFTPTVPQLARPLNGAYVGSAIAAGTRKPKFTWRPATVQGTHGLTYDLQYSSDKTFATGVTTVAGLTPLTFQPAADLAISTTVPKGTRYYWRVRACSGAPCSAYSNPYMVNVGRSDHDFNGDGYADLVVAAPFATASGLSSAGKVYVFFGPSFATASTKRILGAASDQQIGTQLTTGDVNGDGFSDLTLAASVNVGQVSVYYGSANFDVVADKTMVQTLNDGLGTQLTTGDFNGDGYDDLVVSATAADNYSGRVGIYFGSATFDLVPDQTYNGTNPQFFAIGSGLAAADTNGDGFADLEISGSANGTGVANLYMGSSSGPAATSAVSLSGGGMTSAGDMNGDGYEDLLIGRAVCAIQCNSYSVVVNLGSPSGPAGETSLNPPATYTGTKWGYTRSAVGDVNGDGFDDVLVGDSTNPGSAKSWVISGGTSIGTTPSLALQLGDSVTGGGDVNGDGVAEMAVGSTLGGSASGGYAQVYYGANGAPNNGVDLTVNSDSASEYFGQQSSL